MTMLRRTTTQRQSLGRGSSGIIPGRSGSCGQDTRRKGRSLSSRWRRGLTPALLLVLCLSLGGCLKRISGTYRDSSNTVSLDFHRDGKVYAKVFGVPMVGNYEEKDNKIIFKGAEGDMFIDIVDANTLSMSHPLSSFTGEIQLKRQQ